MKGDSQHQDDSTLGQSAFTKFCLDYLVVKVEFLDVEFAVGTVPCGDASPLTPDHPSRRRCKQTSVTSCKSKKLSFRRIQTSIRVLVYRHCGHFTLPCSMLVPRTSDNHLPKRGLSWASIHCATILNPTRIHHVVHQLSSSSPQ